MTRGAYHHLSNTDRVRIETLFNKDYTAKDIANALGIHISTVYRELKRGEWYHRNSNYIDEVSYSSDLAQNRHENAISCRGASMKLANDYQYAIYIEYLIGELKMSPAATLAYIKNNGFEFKTSISIPTLYSYISKNVFSSISNKDLPVISKRKRKYNKVRSKEHKRINGDSIEKRNPNIENREEFGNWEMDTVKGTIRQKSCLLVLTERKTRMEIIRKIKRCSTIYVVKELIKLRKEWGKLFPSVFKTITVDNGVEFSDYNNMILPKKCIDKYKLKIYYCHPFSSYERGSNEVANKLIRRFIPKYHNFENITINEVSDIESWINLYPRKIFNYNCSNRLFLDELVRLLE